MLGLIVMSSISLADPPTKMKITFEPDPETQKLINKVAYTTGGKKEGEAFFETLDLLTKRGGKNYSKLVPNLVYYLSRGKDVQEGMAPGIIIQFLGISEGQILSALLPYVGAEDELFRINLERLIVEMEPGFREQHGFKYIYLRGYADQGELPPRNAVEFLYRKGPGAALLTMTKAYYSGPETDRTRAIRWAEYSVRHVLALKRFNKKGKLTEASRDAVAALDELSKDNEWWVRLYVAEILSQHSEFRTQEMVDRLQGDKDELVRQAISRKQARK